MKNRKILAFDQFQQKVRLRTSRQSQTLPSWMGLFCTILVVVLSLVYLSLRLDILVNHGDSDVANLKMKNAFPAGTVLPVKANSDQDFDFRIFALMWSLDEYDPVE